LSEQFCRVKELSALLQLETKIFLRDGIIWTEQEKTDGGN
jgi:hypothetical protein